MKSITFVPFNDGTTSVTRGGEFIIIPVSSLEFHGVPCDPDHVFRSIQSLAQAFDIAKRFDGMR